ncbi:2-dehydro-3-deoxyphosphooctonate aldolase, partial [sediment metagenome]
MMKEVAAGQVKIGPGHPLCLIGGPCVIESEKSALEHAGKIKQIAEKAGWSFVYKSSYDKANRTSLRSFRGPGLKEGLRILAKVKKETGAPVLSDVHSVEEIREAAETLDVLQIPAFLSRQTDLLLEAGRTLKPVNVKKGQFLSPWEMKTVVEKIESTGNRDILLTERGSFFGYNNLVSDFRSLIIMREFGYPVVYDAS